MESKNYTVEQFEQMADLASQLICIIEEAEPSTYMCNEFYLSLDKLNTLANFYIQARAYQQLVKQQ